MGKQGMRGPQLATAVEPSERRVRPARPSPCLGAGLLDKNSRKFAVCTYFFNVRYKHQSKILHTVPEACKPPRQLEKELLRETRSQRSSRDRKGKVVTVYQVEVTRKWNMFIPSQCAGADF